MTSRPVRTGRARQGLLHRQLTRQGLSVFLGEEEIRLGECFPEALLGRGGQGANEREMEEERA